MLLKKILILPVFTFCVISFFHLIVGDFFYFFLWLFIAALISLSVVPLIIKEEERDVPMMEIFISVILFIIIFAIIIFFDFQQTKTYTLIESTVYSILAGFGVVGVVMILKGK